LHKRYLVCLHVQAADSSKPAPGKPQGKKREREETDAEVRRS